LIPESVLFGKFIVTPSIWNRTLIAALVDELVGELVSELDVIDLVVDDLEAALHSSENAVGEDLLSSRPEDALAQVDVVVV